MDNKKKKIISENNRSKKKRDGPIKRTIAVIVLAIFCSVSFISYFTKAYAAYDYWNKLGYVNFRKNNGATKISLSDITTYGSNITTDAGVIYGAKSNPTFDDVRMEAKSRVTYGKKIEVDSGQEVNIIAAQQDTADAGGEPINSGNKFYWSITEYNSTGVMMYDGEWKDSSKVWTIGQSIDDQSAYGCSGYPRGISQSERKKDVKYIVPIFRLNNGDTHEGSGSNLPLSAKKIDTTFPVFYLVTAPFTYTFDCNGGTVGINNTSSYTVERLGTSNVDGSKIVKPSRPGYNFAGWKIVGGSGKQKDKTYTTEQLKVMMTDGKYWSSLFENATFEAQWELKSYNLTFDANGGNLKYPGNNINNPHGNISNHVAVTYSKDYYNNMSADIPSKEGNKFTGWYLYHQDGNWWEQIYDENGIAVKQDTSCFWYWNGNYAWHYDNDVTLYAGYEVNQYTLKLDANYYNVWFDKLKGDGYDLGTVDLYIDGKLEAANITDWEKTYPYGTSYEFKNIKSKNGYIISDAGSLKGVIKDNTTATAYVYDKVGLAYFDKNSSAGGKGTDKYVFYNMVSLVYNKGSVIGNDAIGFSNSNKTFKYWKTDKSRYYNGGDVMPVDDDYQAKAYIQSVRSNLVMDIAWGGMSNDSGLNIQLADKWDSSGEYWSFIHANDNDYFIVNSTLGKYVTADIANMNVYYGNLDWSNNQLWTLSIAEDGCYYITSKANPNLRITAQGTTSNSNIGLSWKTNNNSQKWKILFNNRDSIFTAQWGNNTAQDKVNVTLIAKYEGIENGTYAKEEKVINNKQYTVGDPITWVREKDVNDKVYGDVSFSQLATADKNQTYYVTIPRKTYTVTLDKSEGISAVSGGGTYRYGKKISISAATMTGYNFAKWTNEDGSALSNNSTVNNIEITDNLRYIANATIQSFPVTVNVRYQDVNGNWGNYNQVISKNYNYGETVTYRRVADDTYKEINYVEEVKGAITKYIDIERKKYTQIVKVRFENADGSFTDYSEAARQDKYYGSKFSWSRNADAVYKAASVAEYTVTGDRTSEITLYRNVYTITVNGDSHVTKTSGSGSYRYGATAIISADSFSAGYHFKNWNDGNTNARRAVTVTGNATYTAYTNASRYNITYTKGNTDSSQTDVTQEVTYDSEVTTKGDIFTGRTYTITYNKGYVTKRAWENTALPNNIENAHLTFSNWNIEGTNKNANEKFVYKYAKNVTATAQYNAAQNKLSSVSRTGYTFAGWKCSLDGKVYNAGDTYTITEGTSKLDVTFTAQWKANSNTKYTVEHYTMNLDRKNYTLRDSETFYGTTDKSVTPVVKNYKGFTSPKTQTVNVNGDGSTVIRYYYTRNTYTLTVNPKDTTWKDGDNSYTNPVKFTLQYEETKPIADPTKTGYHLDHWSINPDNAGSTIKNRTFTMGYEDTTISPVMTANTIEIRYDANGGDSNNNFSITENYDNNFTVFNNNAINYYGISRKPFTRKDCRFKGWKSGNGTWYNAGWNGTLNTANGFPENGSMTLYAQWETDVQVQIYEQYVFKGTNDIAGVDKGYAGTDHSNANDYYLADSSSKTLDIGAVFTYTPTERTGFVTPDAITIKVDNGAPVIKVYYDRKSYNITEPKKPEDKDKDPRDDNPELVKGGNKINVWLGAGIDAVSGVNAKKTYRYGEPVSMTAYIKEGYHWHINGDCETSISDHPTGWIVEHVNSYNANNNNLTFNMPANDVSIAVRATNNSYRIEYITDKPDVASNEISGNMSSQIHIYDEEKSLSKNTFTLTGWTFDGWKSDSTNTYYDEETVKNLTKKNQDVIKLYTKWVPNTYIITFNYDTYKDLFTNDPSLENYMKLNKNGGPDFIEVKYDYPVGNLPEPIVTGMKFLGWFDSHNNEYTSETIYRVVGNITLDAVYQQLTGTFTYKNNGITYNNNGIGEYKNDSVSDSENYNVMTDYVTLSENKFGKVAESDSNKYIIDNNEYKRIELKENSSYAVIKATNGNQYYTFQGWSAYPEARKVTDKNANFIHESGYKDKFFMFVYENLAVKNKFGTFDNKYIDSFDSITNGTITENNLKLNLLKLVSNKELSEGQTDVIMYAIWDKFPELTSKTITISSSYLDNYLENDTYSNAAKTQLKKYLRNTQCMTAVDREDGDLTSQITFEDGSLDMIIDQFLTMKKTTGLTTRNIRVPISVTDSVGNKSYDYLDLWINSTRPANEKKPEIYPDGEEYKGQLLTNNVRVISEKYYNTYKNANYSLETYKDYGGLIPFSLWYTDEDYKNVIEKCFENFNNRTPEQTWYFTHDDVLQVQDFIEVNGIGNSKKEAGKENPLTTFYNTFKKTIKAQ